MLIDFFRNRNKLFVCYTNLKCFSNCFIPRIACLRVSLNFNFLANPEGWRLKILPVHKNEISCVILGYQKKRILQKLLTWVTSVFKFLFSCQNWDVYLSLKMICSPSKITRAPFDDPVLELSWRTKKHFFNTLEFFYFILQILEIYQIEARKAWVTLFDISFIHVESNLAQWTKKGLSRLTDENFVRKFPAQLFLHVRPAFRL